MLKKITRITFNVKKDSFIEYFIDEPYIFIHLQRY